MTGLKLTGSAVPRIGDQVLAQIVPLTATSAFFNRLDARNIKSVGLLDRPQALVGINSGASHQTSLPDW